MSAPSVSVAMPVRNAMPYLAESVGSVLGQTLEDFEFLILDNSSTDGSIELLRDIARSDRRIRLFERSEPLPIAESLNFVVHKGRAPLVARMDADDVSDPGRLERELDVMQRNGDVVLVSTLVEGIDSKGRQVRPRDRWRLMRRSVVPISHGPAMFRRQAFDQIRGYRPAMVPCEDVDLFLRLAHHGRILVLPDALYRYRYHLGSSSLSHSVEDVARSAHEANRALAALRTGRDHADVIERPDEGLVPRDAVVAALYRQGALRLWAGHSPGVLRDLARSGALSWTPRSLRTLLWGAWGSVSPATLRIFLRSLVRARDLAARARLRDGEPYEWRPR
jgi:GT2 family glycosyltransferase